MFLSTIHKIALDAPAAARLQGVFVSDGEIHKLVEFWRDQAGNTSPYAAAAGNPADTIPENVPLKQAPLWEEGAKANGDPLYEDAVAIVRKEGKGSVSMLQRKLRIDWSWFCPGAVMIWRRLNAGAWHRRSRPHGPTRT